MDEIRRTVNTTQLADLRQQYIGRLLQRAYRASADLATVKLHERGHSGLSFANTLPLIHLDLDGTRINVLAERAGMTKQSMGQLVAELESLGYLTRAPDPTDGRATLIQFTEAGWGFLLDAAEIKREIEAEYAAMLGEDRLAALRDSLEFLVRSAAMHGESGG
jgi:DNA-binding MarR family transcriptional regulator